MGFLADVLGVVSAVAPALGPVGQIVGGVAGGINTLTGGAAVAAAVPASGASLPVRAAIAPAAAATAAVGSSAARGSTATIRSAGTALSSVASGSQAFDAPGFPTNAVELALASGIPLLGLVNFAGGAISALFGDSSPGGKAVTPAEAVNAIGLVGFGGGNGRQSTRTIIQTIDTATGQITRQKVKEGTPYLMNKEISTLRKVTNAVRRADRRIPRKTVKESRVKSLTREITENALQHASHTGHACK